jgi:hypothetical protein
LVACFVRVIAVVLCSTVAVIGVVKAVPQLRISAIVQANLVWLPDAKGRPVTVIVPVGDEIDAVENRQEKKTV